MTATQQEIFNHLPADVRTLCIMMGLSRRALYKHLTAMHKAGLIWYLTNGIIERAGKVAEL